MTATYRQRFELTGTPFPKGAYDKSFFVETPGYKRLERSFEMLLEEAGLGVLTAEPGVGKTAAIRNLALALPRPRYRVVYVCDTATGPVDAYRALALELDLEPAFRRAALWRQLKDRILHMVDERDEHPLLIIDEAQNLPDRFLVDFSGFLNFAFDSREVFTTWLVGQPQLRARLKKHHYAALKTRIVTWVHLEPIGSREHFTAFLEHGLKAAGVKSSIIADSARELIYRASGGLPREVGKLLRKALRRADERGQNFIDDTVMEAVLQEEGEI
jgi:type II secretory pathway predicted ATPase ExeA